MRSLWGAELGTVHGTNEAPLYHEVTLLGRLTTGELIGGITRLIRINN